MSFSQKRIRNEVSFAMFPYTMQEFGLTAPVRPGNLQDTLVPSSAATKRRPNSSRS